MFLRACLGHTLLLSRLNVPAAIDTSKLFKVHRWDIKSNLQQNSHNLLWYKKLGRHWSQLLFLAPFPVLVRLWEERSVLSLSQVVMFSCSSMFCVRRQAKTKSGWVKANLVLQWKCFPDFFVSLHSPFLRWEQKQEGNKPLSVWGNTKWLSCKAKFYFQIVCILM